MKNLEIKFRSPMFGDVCYVIPRDAVIDYKFLLSISSHILIDETDKPVSTSAEYTFDFVNFLHPSQYIEPKK